MPIAVENQIPTEDPSANFFNAASPKLGLKTVEIAILNVTEEDKNTERIIKILNNSPLNILATRVCSTADRIPAGGEGIFKTFNSIEGKKFDGMIITGSVSCSSFEKLIYWKELQDIFDWTSANVKGSLFMGWAASAALYHFYGIKKRTFKEKRTGVFLHQRIPGGEDEELMSGISDEFPLPHSQSDLIYIKDIMGVKDLKILAYCKKTGVSILKNADGARVFATEHMEYDRFALKEEYLKNLKTGLNVKPPLNYFTDGGQVKMNWSSTSYLFFLNWLNYCVCRKPPLN